MKAISVKMIDAVAMDADDARNKCYRVGTHDRLGYEITYPDGYKSWCPKDIFDKQYLILSSKNDGTRVTEEDVKNFITDYESHTIGTKNTVVEMHTRTGFDMVEHSACVDPKNYDIKIGTQIALSKGIDRLWCYLGFVLQWAKDGLK